MHYLFLDTEWADEAGRDLVSLALVSADGAHAHYVEIDPLPGNPKPFAADVVYPLLQRGAYARERSAMAKSTVDFLMSFEPAAVLADHHNDLRILRDLIEPAAVKRLLMRGTMLTQMLKDRTMREAGERWFAADPARLARRHHALVDAQALRHAWIEMTQRAPHVRTPSA
ncbi:hypothetical protein V3391_07690 [Luteimonas sp. SMYT11W]|uniref:Uncharacterized protein n=1 Tax=Luteimonas flava TaxID=3115822 RepID=A0ABU7WDS3_9GAMM